MGIEVFHTSITPDIKKKALEKAKIPTVEFKIPDIKPYWGEEDDFDEEEQRYINYVKKCLSHFMKVQVISDPSSNAYLKHENSRLYKLVGRYAEKIEQQEKLIDVHEQETTSLNNQLSNKEYKIELLDDDLTKATLKNEDLTRSLKIIKSMNTFKFWFLKLVCKL